MNSYIYIIYHLNLSCLARTPTWSGFCSIVFWWHLRYLSGLCVLSAMNGLKTCFQNYMILMLMNWATWPEKKWLKRNWLNGILEKKHSDFLVSSLHNFTHSCKFRTVIDDPNLVYNFFFCFWVPFSQLDVWMKCLCCPQQAYWLLMSLFLVQSSPKRSLLTLKE